MKSDLEVVIQMLDRAEIKYTKYIDPRWPGFLIEAETDRRYDEPGYSNHTAVLWFSEQGELQSMGGWEG